MEEEELGLQEQVPLHGHSFALFCLLHSGVGEWSIWVCSCMCRYRYVCTQVKARGHLRGRSSGALRLCAGEGHRYHAGTVEVRERLGVSSLLPSYEFRRLNSGPPTESSPSLTL